MSDELVDIVDEENRVIGQARRSEVRRRNLLHRSVVILCRNRRGDIYVHRRTETKDVFPGMYDMFVGGVVLAGEAYDDAATRELAEELGIAGAAPRFLFQHLYLGPPSRSWFAVYEAEWDGPMCLQESEVAWGSYLSLETLLERLNQWQFVPDGLEIFQRYLVGSEQGRALPGRF